MSNPDFHDEELERKRKMFTFLPVLVVPVAIALFVGLGGGQSSAATSGDLALSSVSAINTSLPGAIIDRPKSKREAYELSDRDNETRSSIFARDPYFDQLRDTTSVVSDLGEKVSSWEDRFNDRTSDIDVQLEELVSQLEDVETPKQTRRSRTSAQNASYQTSVAEEDAKVQELESALAQLSGSPAGGGGGMPPFASMPTGFPMPAGMDFPEEEYTMSKEDSVAEDQLQMLDRIMERATLLQYPELAEEELRKQSAEDAKHLYPVAEAPSAAGDVKIFGAYTAQDSVPPARRRISGGFHTGNGDVDNNVKQLTVRALVHNSMEVMDGSTIKMRLLEDVYVAGQRIAANTFVYGSANLRGDRLEVVVQSIAYRNNIYDVGLNVYDLDGQTGLAVPGSVEREIAKREAARATRSAGGNMVGTNLATQLAADGAQTIKEIASRKLSVIKFELKAGHRVILRNS